VLGVLGTVSAPPDVAGASWGDSEITQQTMTAGFLEAPTSLQCSAGILLPVTFYWMAPSGGVARSGYGWTLANTNNVIVAQGTLAPNTLSFQAPSAILTAGSTLYFRLVALGAGAWESTAVTGTASSVRVILNVVTSCSVS
jgi:hypothetical protein